MLCAGGFVVRSLSHALLCIGVLSRRLWGCLSGAWAGAARHVRMPRSHAALARVRETLEFRERPLSAVACAEAAWCICFLHVSSASRGRGLPSFTWKWMPLAICRVETIILDPMIIGDPRNTKKTDWLGTWAVKHLP